MVRINEEYAVGSYKEADGKAYFPIVDITYLVFWEVYFYRYILLGNMSEISL